EDAAPGGELAYEGKEGDPGYQPWTAKDAAVGHGVSTFFEDMEGGERELRLCQMPGMKGEYYNGTVKFVERHETDRAADAFQALYDDGCVHELNYKELVHGLKLWESKDPETGLVTHGRASIELRAEKRQKIAHRAEELKEAKEKAAKAAEAAKKLLEDYEAMEAAMETDE
ncbi:MAG: hypothetical protein ACKVI4_14755, partial [Actinomycetales bacterium]